jgi:hypothetical protein
MILPVGEESRVNLALLAPLVLEPEPEGMRALSKFQML